MVGFYRGFATASPNQKSGAFASVASPGHDDATSLMLETSPRVQPLPKARASARHGAAHHEKEDPDRSEMRKDGGEPGEHRQGTG